MPLATNLSKMVTYLGLLLPVKLPDPLIKWSCKTSWQTKAIISPLLQCLWPPNLLDINPHNPLNIRSSQVTWQIKIYPHHHNAYGHKNTSGWWHTSRSSHKFLWPLDELISWGNRQIISIYRRSTMDIKPGKVLTYRKMLQPLKSHDSLIMWPTWDQVITWKIYISTFTWVRPKNLAGCWLRGRVLPWKCLKVTSPTKLVFAIK